jgi:hypothetical protein
VEIANILKTLWRLKLLVVLGIVVAAAAAYTTAYKPSFPPSFESKSIEFGSAGTQVLVDSASTPLVDTSQDVSPLSTRAQLYAQLVASEPVKDAIAKAANLDPAELVIQSQTTSSAQSRAAREPSSEERSNQLLADGRVKRLLYSADEGLPVITILSQAATAEEAIRLADAGAKGLVNYLSSLDASKRIPVASRVKFQQLGAARGGMVNQGASKQVAFMAFVGVVGLWCVALLLLHSLIAALRQPDSDEIGPEDWIELGFDDAPTIFGAPRNDEEPTESPAVPRGADAA